MITELARTNTFLLSSVLNSVNLFLAKVNNKSNLCLSLLDSPRVLVTAACTMSWFKCVCVWGGGGGGVFFFLWLARGGGATGF